MRSALNRFSASSAFGNGHHANATGGAGDFFETFLSNSWPYEDAVSPLQAYLLGVFTCMVLFLAYNVFLHSSISMVPRHPGGSRKRNSPAWKRKNRNLLASGTMLPTTNCNTSKEIHRLRPPARMAEISPSKDRVYRRLTSRIRERSAKRVLRKSKRMTKNTSGTAIDYDLAQYSIGRNTDRHWDEDSTKLICRVVDHHPIARNRARYNQKQTASHSKRSESKMQTMASASAYNDRNIWSSSSSAMVSNKFSYELFRHMNSHPLHKDVQKSCTTVVSMGGTSKIPLSSSSCDEQGKIQDSHAHKTVSSRKDLVSEKENVDRQLVSSDSPKDVTPRIKSSGSIAKRISLSSTMKSNSSSKAIISPAKETYLNKIESQKYSKDDEDKSKDIAPISKKSQETQLQLCSPKPQKKVISKAVLRTQQPEDNDLVTRIDQPPGTESIPTKSGDAGNNSTLVAPKARLTVLISNGVYDYSQKANQKNALNTFDDLGIPYDLVDGMDPLQKEKRDEFFEISGVRGNYPQIFSSAEADGTDIYLGGYNWLHSSKIEDLIKFASK